MIRDVKYTVTVLCTQIFNFTKAGYEPPGIRYFVFSGAISSFTRPVVHSKLDY